MTEFTCLTCQEKGDNSAIARHLSLTRHKLVESEGETVACEECGDVNIHVLEVVRYGLSEMQLVCRDCSARDQAKNGGDPPTAVYLLSNGTLFAKLDQYYRFRDLSCDKCDADEQLLASKGLVMCAECIAKHGGKREWVAEGEPLFLYELLGITEFIPLKNSKAGARGRKMGRKGGKDGGRRRTKPPVDEKEAAERRAHYEKTVIQAKQIKGGATIKAIGSGKITPKGILSGAPSTATSPAGSRSQSPALGKPAK